MKKSVNPMDQAFKDSFQGATESTDVDSLWPFVEQQLPKNESKGLLFYFSWGILLFLMTSAAWVWFSGEPSDSSITLEAPSKEPIAEPVLVQKASTLPSRNSTRHYSEHSLMSSAVDLGDKQVVFSAESKNVTQPVGADVKAFSTDLSASGRKTLATLQQPAKAVSPLELKDDLFTLSLQQLTAGDPKWSRCSDEKSLGLGLFVEGYALGGYPLISNSLNSNQETGDQNFLQSWNHSESAVSTFSAGILFGLETTWGGSISAGLEYQQIQNQLKQEQRISERITIFDEMAYFFIDSNNNRVYVADSVTTTRTYTRQLQTAKTHTLINLPILLGYHRQIGKFRYGIIGGVIFHLRNEFQGKVLAPSGQIIDASSGEPTAIYRKTLNLSLVGGLDAGYFISEGLELYLSPRFRYQGASWLQSDHPVESQIQLLGLQGGVRLHL
jgi:hypothetical protein